MTREPTSTVRMSFASVAIAAVLLAVPATAAEDDPPPRDTWFHAAGILRFAFIPGSFLDKYFTVHEPIYGFAPGFEVGVRKHQFNALLTFEILAVASPEGVWLFKGDSAEEAVWVDPHIRLISLVALFAYEIPIGSVVGLVPCIGFGPRFRDGFLQKFHTYGDADTPIDERQKVPDDPGGRLGLIGDVSFLSDVGFRVRIRPTKRFFFSAGFGYRQVLYVGLAAGATLP